MSATPKKPATYFRAVATFDGEEILLCVYTSSERTTMPLSVDAALQLASTLLEHARIKQARIKRGELPAE